MQARGHQVRGGVAPDLQVVVDGELEEAARQARVGVPTRREVEQRPAHVVLLGAQGHVVARLHAPEALGSGDGPIGEGGTCARRAPAG